MNEDYQKHIEELMTADVMIDTNEIIVYQYLKNFEPAASLEEDGAYLRSTNALCDDLSEMVSLTLQTMSSLMIHTGYHLVCDKEDEYTPGWLMKKV